MPPKRPPVNNSRKSVNPTIGQGGRKPAPKRKDSFQDNIPEMDQNDEEIDYQNENRHQSQQLKLTQKELNEDMPSRMLQPQNPQAPSNTTAYDYSTRKFKTDFLPDQMIVHFSMDGNIIFKDSAEYKIQESIQEYKQEQIQIAINNQKQEDPNAPQDLQAIKQTMRNKFNYSLREAQTINVPVRQKGISTEPPPSDVIKGSITQWEIFDAYIAQAEKQKEKEKKKSEEPAATQSQGSFYSAGFKKCVKIMERMVVQNEQEEMYDDYRYYWERGDNLEAGKQEGHLLPIWRFSNEKHRKKNVTSICWNPKYPDLFAISLGSYQFLKQRPGTICIYSLKNTTHPEYTYSCDSGAMCLDFHPSSPALLAVGNYDGTVQVFDIRNKQQKAIYSSNVRTSQHTDPVWEVRWNPDTSKNFNFYSISSDGRVMNWVLMKNQLEPEEIILLRLVGKNDEDSTLIGLACGLCFDFNQFYPQIFLVGTEEGKIHKCSRAYSGQYQNTYSGHLLAVYKVRWNNYHPDTFISASADWTVRIWHVKYDTQIMCFDRGTQVVDAVWAPYSSTVFACCTLDQVYVYDLAVDKHEKLAELKPAKQPKLTNLAFNWRDYILLVGNTHGGVTLVQLSPNLHQIGPDASQYEGGKIPEDIKSLSRDEFEKRKMQDLLTVVSKWERDDA